MRLYAKLIRVCAIRIKPRPLGESPKASLTVDAAFRICVSFSRSGYGFMRIVYPRIRTSTREQSPLFVFNESTLVASLPVFAALCELYMHVYV